MADESGIKCGCGGNVSAHRVESDDPGFAVELVCDSCGACDPNGYATIGEALSNGGEYFKGVEDGN